MNNDNQNNVQNNQVPQQPVQPQQGQNQVQNVINQVTQPPQEQVIDVSNGAKRKDGQVVCPNCGASEISPNPKTGKLRCDYCACEFDGKSVENVITDLSNLRGKVRGKGTSNIKADTKDVVTLKCGGCGAEVVIDTANAPHARCHWCRSILSVNSQIENGSTPDVILPFKEQKASAQKRINDFVGKRKFFAHPKFKKEFTTENIMGVYFPYMIVDANCHAKYKGQGEHLVRSYTVGSGDNRETRYDADLYNVGREFDITIDDLTIESNSTRLDKTSNSQTNNIINSIMPFDTENCIQYEPNFLVGYTSERRDVNIEEMEEHVTKQFKDVAKFAAKEDAKFYNRGIKWDQQDLQVFGTQWLAAYLPVWLYSYLEVKGSKKVLHYVAVNARTGETMGSVPINIPLLIGISSIIEVICIILCFALLSATSSSDDDDGGGFLLLLLGGFVFYGIMYMRYRNKGARHTYEQETKKNVTNMVREDVFVEKRKGLKNAIMQGSNESQIEGDVIQKSFLEKKFEEATRAATIKGDKK